MCYKQWVILGDEQMCQLHCLMRPPQPSGNRPKRSLHGMVQARAHALLKAKDMELRTARDEASAQFAAELADARAGLAELERQLAQVHTKPTSCANKPCYNAYIATTHYSV